MDDWKADILMVDDDPRNLLALEALLEPLGQNLLRAHSGEEALRFMLKHNVAVILLDVRMTGDPENGTKALALLEGHPLVKEAKAEGAHLTIGFVGAHDELPQILSLLVSSGLPVASFAQREADLEDVFMKVTKGMVQ